jgi:hypothetical protein
MEASVLHVKLYLAQDVLLNNDRLIEPRAFPYSECVSQLKSESVPLEQARENSSSASSKLAL